MNMDQPIDIHRQTLATLARAGNDMTAPMLVDFAIAAANEAAARAIASAVSELGYRADVFADDDPEDDEETPDEGSWTCNCRKQLIVSLEAIVAAEAELNQLAEPHGGGVAGWSSFGNRRKP